MTPDTEANSHEPGRKSKRTPETDEVTLRLLMEGCTHREVAAAIGVHQDTFWYWTRAYPDFAALVQKGEAAARREAIGIIQKVARGGIVLKDVTTTTTSQNGVTTERREVVYSEPQWTAAAWFLERRDSEQWGRKDTIKFQLQRVMEDTRKYAKEQGLTDEEAEAAVKEIEAMLKG